MPDRVDHILRSIDAVLAYWKGKEKTAYAIDELRRAATERHSEIISEASPHIPGADKADHPQVPWKDIANIGNVLRHRCDTISDDRIWDIGTLDLRALRRAILKIMVRRRSPTRRGPLQAGVYLRARGGTQWLSHPPRLSHRPICLTSSASLSM